MSPELRQALVRKAMAARRQAYAPYSGFAVGAALLAADGRVFAGCNVETASFGLTLCAERTALTSAVAAGRRRFQALALAADAGTAPMPCGACLQVLAEFCGPGLPIIAAWTRDPAHPVLTTLGRLLPRAFRLHIPEPHR